ncbi:tetratricopeptide repeat protein [Afipia sp. GAS231]|uniref:tetratricopeptide repeat protein n=1 Tax=Afipia sp. GAS231 TaxID=1882747 RepID=UPI000B831745|nr:tetratricopeptide repeat protein [Afipia sp. GAS231]
MGRRRSGHGGLARQRLSAVADAQVVGCHHPNIATKKHPTKAHPDLADVLDNLAGVYTDQGRTADAEPLHKRSAAIRAKAAAKPI